MSSTTQDDQLMVESSQANKCGNSGSISKSQARVSEHAGAKAERATVMNTSHSIDDEFMSPEEIMRYLKIKRTKCYELLVQGVIPSFRIGRLRRSRRSEIDSWLESQHDNDRKE